MIEVPQVAERARLDALMYRMLGALLLLGAAVLLCLTFLLLQLPRVTGHGGTLLLLPGTGGRHGLSVLALPALGSGAFVLGVGGLAALALGRRQAPFGMRPRVAARARAGWRPALVLLAGLGLLAAVLLRR